MEILHILIRVSTQIQEDDGTSLKTQQEQFQLHGTFLLLMIKQQEKT